MRILSIKLHRLLAILGGIGLLLWGGSGLLHPIITTWGPQQAVFYPPSHPVDLAGVRPIHETLAEAGIAEAAAIRIVPGDKVKVALSPYDLTRGRIIYRER